MAVLGTIPGKCNEDIPYTGSGNCPKGEGALKALIITGKAARYPTNETFEDNLPALVYSNGIDRIYPVKDVLAVEPSGGDTQTVDLGNGYVRPIRTNQYIQTVRVDGGDCLFKQLSKWNGQTVRVFRVDQDNYVYGTIVTSPAGDQEFAGFLATIYVRSTPGTDSDIYTIYIDIYYTVQRDKELINIHAIRLENDIPDGLVPVIVVDGQVIGECSGEDYTSQYGTEWTADMFINSSGGAPTGVAYNSATNKITFTPTGTYRVADASVLAPAGIYGLTGVPL